jgi:hypothetical protein
VGRVKKSISILIILFVVLCSLSCARPVAMKIRPLGVLENEDYKQLEVVANQSPVKVGKSIGSVCEPTLVYYLAGGYDFSAVKSIYIPDFKSLDNKTDQTVTKNTADDVAALFLKKGLFQRVVRLEPSEADVELRGVIVRYQEITGAQAAGAFVTGGARCGFCEMEIKIIDSKTNTKIGAIQINHVTGRGGGFLTWSGSRRPETQIPEFLATIFEMIRAGQTGWTSGIAFDCVREDGTKLLDLICK